MITAAHHTMLQKIKKLPYDAELEYIQCSGKQYIDTGVAPDNNLLSYDILCVNLTTAALPRATFGCRANTSSYSPSSYCTYFRSTSGAEARADIVNNGTYVYVSAPYEVETRFEWDAPTKTLTVTNNNTSNTYTAETKEFCGSSFFIGTINTNGTATSRGTLAKFISAKFWLSGELVLDFIPVRFTNELSNSEAALYNKLGTGGVNKDGTARIDGLYRNRGTEDFILGPDK